MYLLLFCFLFSFLFFFLEKWGLEREGKGGEGVKDGCLWQARAVNDQACCLLPRSPIPQ